MPVLAIYRSKTVTREQYDTFRASLPLDQAPKEALIHAFAKPVDGSLCLVEIWESADALRAYNESHVNPQLAAAGLEALEPELLDVETLAVSAGVSDYRIALRRVAEPA